MDYRKARIVANNFARSHTTKFHLPLINGVRGLKMHPKIGSKDIPQGLRLLDNGSLQSSMKFNEEVPTVDRSYYNLIQKRAFLHAFC